MSRVVGDSAALWQDTGGRRNTTRREGNLLRDALGHLGSWLPALLVPLLGSGWLVSTRILTGVVIDVLGFGGWLVFMICATPAFAGACLWSIIYLLCQLGSDEWGPSGDWRRAVPPLAVNAAALAVFLYAPLSRPVEWADFWLHYAARMEVAQRVESGELRPSPPIGSAAPLVSLHEYPWSTSRWGDKKRAAVYREDDALHVVFFPMHGERNDRSVFVYRSDRRPPSLPSEYLPAALRSEPLADRWYRVGSR